MTSKVQNRGLISRIRRRAVSVALALAVMLVAGMVATPSAQAQTYSILHTFTGPPDGSEPHAGLVRDAAGNLYGTTYYGGVSGYGAVFMLDMTNHEMVLHSFTGAPDGATPIGGLFRDAAGNLYGTTSYGGVSGYGTLFKVDPTGMETVLYSFTGGTDGDGPFAGLIQDAAGNLYGTTFGGGASGYGTVFKLDTTGRETLLHSFAGYPTDGGNPTACLVMDSAGNLYGTTFGGGTYGNGTVFKVDPTGMETVLYSFTGGTDGSGPSAGLAQDAAGNFYGTTYYGGNLTLCSGSGCGTVFKLEGTGTETVLHTFTGPPDGAYSLASLIQDAAGNLYGTTQGGGASGYGVVFELEAGGSPSVSLSPASLNFGPQGVQAPNVPQVVTLTNTGQAPLSITSIAIAGQNSGDFAQANNCPISPNTLAAGDNCMITVYFFPTGAGTLNADVTITDNAPNSPQNLPLSGTGVSGKPGLAGPQK